MSPRALSNGRRPSAQSPRERGGIPWAKKPVRRSDSFNDADLATILNALRALSVQVRRSAPLRRPVVLRPNELLLLRQVRAMPGASISTLARELHTDASAVSVLVTRLARRRLLRRARASRDARMATIRITSRGVLALEQSPSPIVLRDSVAVRALSPELRRVLARHLQRLANVLE